MQVCMKLASENWPLIIKSFVRSYASFIFLCWFEFGYPLKTQIAVSKASADQNL